MEADSRVAEHRMSFAGALSVILFLMVAVTTQVFVFDNSGAIHITLILVIVFASVIAMGHGYSWRQVQEGLLQGCHLAMLPMLILMMVGVLIASWIAAGTIPVFIYYGMHLLSAEYFLFSACLICSLGSISTGSSWTTSATFGVAFMGIGSGLSIPLEYTAGAVISGSIFGDKMSPLSDSTNLAAGIVGADLFEHIKSMVYSTGPALILTLITFFFFGLSHSADILPDESKIQTILNGLEANYSLGLITLLPPVLVIVMAMKKMDGLLVMVTASLVAAVIAITIQDASVNRVFSAMNYGYKSETGVAEIDSLLQRGGLQSMMWTVSLGFIALGMGGLLEKTMMLNVLLKRARLFVKTMSGLVTTHVISSILVNLFAASQFIAIIIPGRMLLPAYRKLGLLPQVCSRVCEDSATVTSPLVPWGLGGVFYASVLGVTALEYFPYTFLAFFAPLMTLLLAFTDTFMFKENASKIK